MGASEELPLGSHFSSPVSGSVTFSSEVLQHNNAAKSEDLTPKSELASVPLSSFPPLAFQSCHCRPQRQIPRSPLLQIFRTRTFFLTISWQPMDKDIVTHSGMPSGIAA